MSNLLEKLDKEITEQTRNGRDMMYIETSDLEELGMSEFKNKGRVWIKVECLNKIIRLYKDKNITPEEILQKRNEAQWEK